jgi:hypothetical protein
LQIGAVQDASERLMAADTFSRVWHCAAQQEGQTVPFEALVSNATENYNSSMVDIAGVAEMSLSSSKPGVLTVGDSTSTGSAPWVGIIASSSLAWPGVAAHVPKSATMPLKKIGGSCKSESARRRRGGGLSMAALAAAVARGQVTCPTDAELSSGPAGEDVDVCLTMDRRHGEAHSSPPVMNALP